ncbi:hypothetical protein DES49_2709 [Halospina denitrificans]|uniref:Uncharacterized protein n=1 Tax=Halospina denitrificans TaxID=332522 RepID=A0A4R7JM33_9GAMM|nr:hypothetical protein [Halospina denitrificans]TDT37749.1 hypothetical protein DES49_2709 [Halospina denitrificans]
MARQRSIPMIIGPWAMAFVAVVMLAVWGYLSVYHQDSGLELSSMVDAHRVETTFRPGPLISLPSGGLRRAVPLIHGGAAPPPAQYRVSVKADEPQVPAQARLNDGFRTSVRFRVTVAAEGGASEREASQEAAIRREIQRRLQVRLDLAGAQVQPQGPVPVGRDLRASWSVIASRPGNLRGQIATALEATDSGDGVVPDELPGTIPLAINVSEPTFQLGRMAQAATLGIGLLASLVSLIEFVWKWRERRAS